MDQSGSIMVIVIHGQVQLPFNRTKNTLLPGWPSTLGLALPPERPNMSKIVWFRMVTRLTQNMILHSPLTAAWDRSKRDRTYWSILPNVTISRLGETFPETAFFPAGYGTPITVSKVVKDQGVQKENMFFPLAQCTEAASEATVNYRVDGTIEPLVSAEMNA